MMKIQLFQRLTLILLFLIECSSMANGQSQISSSSLEIPIRFQVEIPTNYPDSKASLLYEKDWGVLMLPKNYKSTGNPVPLVIGCHGGGGTVKSNGSQIESYVLYKYLVSLGYAIMDSAGMPESYSTRLKTDHYRCEGSYIAIRAYEAGYKWIISNYNIDPKGCYITGGSNGGLTAANLVSISTIPVICQAGKSPLLSIKEQAWNITGGDLAGESFLLIKTLDALLDAKYEDEKVGNYDPFNYEVTFEGDKMIKKNRCPVKIWHPVDDPIISIDFSRKFVSALNNAGVKSQLVEMPGGGHAPESYGQTLGYFEYQGKKI